MSCVQFCVPHNGSIIIINYHFVGIASAANQKNLAITTEMTTISIAGISSSISLSSIPFSHPISPIEAPHYPHFHIFSNVIRIDRYFYCFIYYRPSFEAYSSDYRLVLDLDYMAEITIYFILLKTKNI